ncbi:MAG: ATPase [Deltaproteobacteria bacterium]|nr:ATPase [Deltaproteobacteria bacterium]
MNLAKRLLQAEAVSQEQLSQALHRQKKFRGFLADHLIALGILKAAEVAEFIPPYPLVPQTFDEIGLPENFLAQLLLKHAFFRYTFTAREMAEALAIPEHLVDVLIEYLQQQKYVDISPRDALTRTPLHLATDIRYTLSNSGKESAGQQLEFNSYVGAVPVTLEDYWDWVEAQSIQKVHITAARLHEAFKDYVIPQGLFNEIQPAIASGRSIFLFGPSGNGKTALARCIGEIFEDTVYVPHALYVHGQIIRIFDEFVHEPQIPTAPLKGQDARWIQCRRPVVIAGGEMTEAALEPKYNPVSKYYEAPHQVQANNGVFIIDDFGRQKISPQKLLNRWMYPLEGRQDFCSLHTGQQFAVPFDELIIFCTNLDPYALADEAFLRRIRHKVFIGEVSQEQYLEIFRRACDQYGVNFDGPAIQEMIEKYYIQGGRPFRACHPRDLIENLSDRARSLGQGPQLTFQAMDLACQSYFIKSRGIIDHDKDNWPARA